MSIPYLATRLVLAKWCISGGEPTIITLSLIFNLTFGGLELRYVKLLYCDIKQCHYNQCAPTLKNTDQYRPI